MKNNKGMVRGKNTKMAEKVFLGIFLLIVLSIVLAANASGQTLPQDIDHQEFYSCWEETQFMNPEQGDMTELRVGDRLRLPSCTEHYFFVVDDTNAEMVRRFGGWGITYSLMYGEFPDGTLVEDYGFDDSVPRLWYNNLINESSQKQNEFQARIASLEARNSTLWNWFWGLAFIAFILLLVSAMSAGLGMKKDRIIGLREKQIDDMEKSMDKMRVEFEEELQAQKYQIWEKDNRIKNFREELRYHLENPPILLKNGRLDEELKDVGGATCLSARELPDEVRLIGRKILVDRCRKVWLTSRSGSVEIQKNVLGNGSVRKYVRRVLHRFPAWEICSRGRGGETGSRDYFTGDGTMSIRPIDKIDLEIVPARESSWDAKVLGGKSRTEEIHKALNEQLS